MNLKDKFKNNKKIYIYFGIGFIAMFLIIIFIAILTLVVGNKVSYQGAEVKIKNAAKKYYGIHQDKLPGVDQSITINIDELVNAKYIKSLDNLLKEDAKSCKASVTITNNNGKYLYNPYLDCGNDYKTSTIYDKIIDDNGITSSKDGLYDINGNYVFRGEKVNNYVSFANKTWRILRLNSDKTIRLMEIARKDIYNWDDRYNVELSRSYGINDYTVSRIRDQIKNLYETEFDDYQKSYIKSQNVCIGKQNIDSSKIDGSVECSSTISGEYASTLQVNEYVLASIDKTCKLLNDAQCINYNYLSTIKNSYWTITASTERTDKVFKISNSVQSSRANANATILLVIHLDGNIIYSSGDGTINNPYIIK